MSSLEGPTLKKKNDCLSQVYACIILEVSQRNHRREDLKPGPPLQVVSNLLLCHLSYRATPFLKVFMDVVKIFEAALLSG